MKKQKKLKIEKPAEPLPGGDAGSNFVKGLLALPKKAKDKPVSALEVQIIKQQGVAHKVISDAMVVIDDVEVMADYLRKIRKDNEYEKQVNELDPTNQQMRKYADFVVLLLEPKFRENAVLVFSDPDTFRKTLSDEAHHEQVRQKGTMQAPRKKTYAETMSHRNLDPDNTQYTAHAGNIIGNCLNLCGAMANFNKGFYRHTLAGVLRDMKEGKTEREPDFILHSASTYALIGVHRIYCKHSPDTNEFIYPQSDVRRLRMIWGRYVFHSGSMWAVLDEAIAVIDKWCAHHREIASKVLAAIEKQTEEGVLIDIDKQSLLDS